MPQIFPKLRFYLGASIDTVSADGLNTALSIAYQASQDHIVELLLHHAAFIKRI